ncbi:ADP-ribosylation factor-like protein 13B [Platysternon megacephalum]|uniref:ADP-ribosylation factor-like protein 13B n=1 Tax=Platysternon megacephalum TaxID=55544 RepID=A0A4D9EAX4_9SAUR|nr:ADP-ribosylation factor-like protein 13B [Platysternon megacephalum]
MLYAELCSRRCRPLAPPLLHVYDTVHTNHIAPLLFLTSTLANYRTQSYIRIQFTPISVRCTITSLQKCPIDSSSTDSPIKSLRCFTCVVC